VITPRSKVRDDNGLRLGAQAIIQFDLGRAQFGGAARVVKDERDEGGRLSDPAAECRAGDDI